MRAGSSSAGIATVGRLAVAAAIALALVPAAARAADDTYALKPVYKAGEVERYRTVITYVVDTPMGVSQREVTIDTTETTRDVKPDGTATVETKVDSAKANLDGSQQEVGGGGETLTTVYDSAGRVVKQEGGFQPGSAAQMLNIARAVFAPEHPLKLGEAYKYSSEAKTDAGTRRVSGVLTAVGIEKKSADVPVDVLRVNNASDTVIAAPTGEQKMHADGYWLIDLANSKPVKLQGKITGIRSGTSSVTLLFSRTRLFGEAGKK